MTAKPDMQVRIGAMRMKNPVMVASGTFGYGPEYADLVDLNRLGAIVVKGICVEPTSGNPTPRTFEVESGLINAIGLPNPGFEGFVREYMAFLRGYDVAVIVNIWGRTVDEYVEIARRFNDMEGVHALEVNVSCPNIKEGSCMFGTNIDLFREVITRVRGATALPVIPKLAPDVSDIACYAQAAEECGADAISLINSFPALAINVETRRPEIANVTGGLTGPAIHSIAVRLVWQVSQAVHIPVIGIGGITEPKDALEFIIAGASAVAVGTASFSEPTTAIGVIDGIAEYLGRHGYKQLAPLVGSLEV